MSSKETFKKDYIADPVCQMYTYTEEEMVEMATKTGTCLGYTINIINDLEDLDIDDKIKVRLKIVEDILTKFWRTT